MAKYMINSVPFWAIEDSVEGWAFVHKLENENYSMKILQCSLKVRNIHDEGGVRNTACAP